jgi:catechol 2,3-dioxygenase-like lactoylglutathione lyase family enzyme
MATRIRPEEKQASLPMEGAEAPIKAEGFNHLHINVRDLARSIRFYKEAFELKVGFSAGKDLIFMVPLAGGHSLALHQVGPDEPVGMAGLDDPRRFHPGNVGENRLHQVLTLDEENVAVVERDDAILDDDRAGP